MALLTFFLSPLPLFLRREFRQYGFWRKSFFYKFYLISRVNFTFRRDEDWWAGKLNFFLVFRSRRNHLFISFFKLIFQGWLLFWLRAFSPSVSVLNEFNCIQAMKPSERFFWRNIIEPKKILFLCCRRWLRNLWTHPLQLDFIVVTTFKL